MNTKRALIVDDEYTAQIILKYLLESLGYEVLSASNGKAAVTLYEEHAFSLIFMDFNMPEMDGITATEVIRTRKQESLPPKIIGITAFANQESLQKGLDAGMNLVISKPIQITDLENSLLAIA